MVETIISFIQITALIVISGVVIFLSWKLTPFFLSNFDKSFHSPAKILGWRLRVVGSTILVCILFVAASAGQILHSKKPANIEAAPLPQTPLKAQELTAKPIAEIKPPEIKKDVSNVDEVNEEALADHQLYDTDSANAASSEQTPPSPTINPSVEVEVEPVKPVLIMGH